MEIALEHSKLRLQRIRLLSSEVVEATNASTCRGHGSHLYPVCDASNQTPSHNYEAEPEIPPQEQLEPPSEESHFQVDFPLFEDVVLGADRDIPGLLRMSKHVTRCPEFIALQIAYTEAFGEKETQTYTELDPDIELMRLFNFILSKARSSNLSTPYAHEIYYGKRPESVSDPSSKKPKVTPRCLGVEVVGNGTDVLYEFSNSIVIIDANPPLY